MTADTLEQQRLRWRINNGPATKRDIDRARELGLRGIRQDRKTGRHWDDGTRTRGDWEKDRGES